MEYFLLGLHSHDSDVYRFFPDVVDTSLVASLPGKHLGRRVSAAGDTLVFHGLLLLLLASQFHSCRAFEQIVFLQGCGRCQL
eukprot:4464782-Amphidinium_carterae.1